MADSVKKIQTARSLRSRSTPADRRLWSRLKGNQLLGLQFVRQQPIDKYVADFYCSIARVVIELDGYSHCFTSKADDERHRYLEAQGTRVLRFSNAEVMNDLERVLLTISDSCRAHVVNG